MSSASRRVEHGLGPPDQLAGPVGRAPGQRDRGVEQLVVVDAPPRQTDPGRFLAGSDFAEDHQRRRGLPSDQPLHAPQVATARVDAEVHEARIEAGLR